MSILFTRTTQFMINEIQNEPKNELESSTPEVSDATAFYLERKAKDQALYDAWKESGSKEHLGSLMDQLSPIIFKEVQRTSGSLPRAALSSAAKKWAVKAIQTYDPSKGASLSTHVTSYLRKVRRTNYKFQNAVMLPEDLHLKFESFRHARESLSDELSREPTDEELAHHIGWSKPQVVKFKKSLYDDLIESGSEHPSEFTQFNENALLMEYLNNSLSKDELFMMHNAGKMPAKEMADKLSINISRLNYIKSKLIKKIDDIKHQLGT